MHTQRPVNLNLFSMRFPMPAIVSILHRISGVILFLLLPLFLWLLSCSLASESSFAALHQSIAYPVFKFFVWALLSALTFHLIAGIRHLLMDIGLGETLKAGRCSSALVLVFSTLIMMGLGVWLW